MTRRPVRPAFLTLAAVLLTSVWSGLPLAAQAAASRSAAPTQIVAINPFMPLLGWFAGEYERRVQQNLAMAVSGSYVGFGSGHYANIDAKLRLYPQDRPLEGVGLAAGFGVGSIRRDSPYCTEYYAPVPSPSGATTVQDPTGCRRTESAPTFSMEGQYQWLLGNRRATAIAIGAGVKRYFVSDANAGGLERVLPTLRLTIGYGFR